uniref:Uncharacterized protein n=1 Tax=Tetraselmis sp. GSL018 TaxID=582737 RepID=A0A061RJK9_9CHLO|eukprot:CAMPEP_0177583246 /NCGR_PEP_ID=MMETSP0419_2-20121207/3214_1 /TAXON_ID=582737 /ORGANISM="Tetraselmis sp., Strain GSL018" /LENGTH=301 /DNA_ID=CAMNT_0019072613 /DNA_START=658 /DNA_END=1563 /DNA_ORIENTATION=+
MGYCGAVSAPHPFSPSHHCSRGSFDLGVLQAREDISQGLLRQIQSWKEREDVQDLAEEISLDLVAAGCSAPDRPAVTQEEDAAICGLVRDGTITVDAAGKLVAIVRELRDTESSPDFLSGMAVDVRAALAASGYSRDNFAYGSTPLPSWLSVFLQPEVRCRMEGMKASGLRYAVLGSSIGWLVFFGAVIFGVDSLGLEMLPRMVAVAEGVRSRHQVIGAEFRAGDFLEEPLGGVGLVMLASQCWDKHLVSAAGRKLAEELPAGALAVDYTNALGPFLGEPRLVVEVPVSWNPAQRILVFEK